MPDFLFEKWIGPLRVDAAARLAVLGMGTRALMFAAFIGGLAALPSIATGRFRLGIAFILLSRAIAWIGGAAANLREADMASTFELIFLASIPFAFALHDPSSGLSASLLLFSMIAIGAASLFANPNGRIAAIDIAICVAAFVVACLRPDWYALIAYLLSLFCFVSAGARIALAFTRSDP